MAKRWRAGVVVGAVMAMAASGVLGGAPGASAEPGGRAALAAAGEVAVGSRPPLPAGTGLIGTLPASTPMAATVALEPADPAALATYAAAVSTPGSASYRAYLTPAEFASRFGSPAPAASAVRRDLSGAGLAVDALAANHLSFRVHGSARTFSHAFATGFSSYRLPSGRTAYGNTVAPRLPGAIAGQVQAVIGLDTLTVPQPAHLTAPAPPEVSPAIGTGGPQPCAAEINYVYKASVPPLEYAYSADQLAAAYNFSGLYRAGDLGRGQTVALFEDGADNPADIAAYQTCLGTSASVGHVDVDGGVSGPPVLADEEEATLDIEILIGMAPKANILVYDGPGSGYDLYGAMVTQDKAAVISASFTSCEIPGLPAEVAAENTLFEEAATQGQTVVVASGDDGSSCLSADSSTLSVNDAASQPYVTGVGGTSLTAVGPPPTERVWGRLPHDSGETGGGISAVWSMPAYQSGARRTVDVISAHSSGAPCGAPAGNYCREVPDVSADADPYTGYVIYFEGQWITVGGTSASTPLWAALFALGNASSSCDGSTIGFANPALYAVAGTSRYLTDFHDIRVGNNANGYTPGDLYPAGVGYDMASGLGSPDAAPLVADLCRADTVVPGRTLVSTTTTGLGYLVASASGNVYNHGTPFHGSPAAERRKLTSPVVGIAATGPGGYLLATAGGNIYNYGTAFHGSPVATGGKPARPVVGIAAAGNGGYLVATTAGNVYNYGTAFRGSPAASHLTPASPVVGITATAGGGYLLVTKDGVVYAYGTSFHGSPSTSHLHLTSSVVGITATAGGGYVVATAAGNVYNYATAFHGSPLDAGVRLAAPLVGLAATANGGYLLVAADGVVYRYDAEFR